MTRHLLLKY